MGKIKIKVKKGDKASDEFPVVKLTSSCTVSQKEKLQHSVQRIHMYYFKRNEKSTLFTLLCSNLNCQSQVLIRASSMPNYSIAQDRSVHFPKRSSPLLLANAHSFITLHKPAPNFVIYNAKKMQKPSSPDWPWVFPYHGPELFISIFAYSWLCIYSWLKSWYLQNFLVFGHDQY